MKYVFLTLNIIVYSSAHFLMFLLWRYFFSLDSFPSQVSAAAILFLLASLTIIAPLLIHWRDNIGSRALYLIIALWAGFMLNSVILAVAFFIFLFILNDYFLLSSSWSVFYIIFLPLLMLIPEFWAANSIKVKEVDVCIKDLPEAWKNKKIVHISDIHLGPIWRQKFFNKVVDRVNSLSADAIFITGDLFDGMEADFSWFHQRRFLAPLGTYYAFGNHDIILGKYKIKKLLNNSNIRILDDELHLEQGLQIIGLSCYYEGKMDVEHKLLKEIKIQLSRPSILLYHEPKDIRAIRNSKIDLQLSGHLHAGQMFPFNLLAKFLYKGFVHGVYKVEDFTLSLTAGVGTWGPPLRLFTRSEIVLLKLLPK